MVYYYIIIIIILESQHCKSWGEWMHPISPKTQSLKSQRTYLKKDKERKIDTIREGSFS